MEEGLGSGGVVKKKSSSGCLIIKKKVDPLGSSVRPSKSSRMIKGEFGSSDDTLENSRRNVNDKMPNEPIVYSRRVQESREFGRNGDVNESDGKRSRMDLFEFDEYDEFDMKRMRNDYMEMMRRSGGGREFGSGSRAVMVEKRKRAYFDGLVSGLSGRTKVTSHGGKRRYDSDEDEANLPLSALRLKSEESAGAIRLQGKSGVLKVMMNKKKKMELPSARKFDHQQVENRKRFESEDATKKEFSVRSPVSSDSQRTEKRVGMLEGEESPVKLQKLHLDKRKKSENFERDATEIKLHKSQLGKSKKAGNSKSDLTERSSKVASPSLPDGGSMKAIKREENRFSLTENVAPVKVKERKISGSADDKVPIEVGEEKAKRGGSTEKQLLREKIREMLIKAGWKIEYRPRRDRDYLDAVYINPSGTAFWSIIKAYDALQKQMPKVDDENKSEGQSSSFVPLSDDLINKLTRKTRKKIEEEMKKNSAGKKGGCSGVKKSKKAVSEVSNEDSDDDQPKERLGSYGRQNGKAKKASLHEEDSDSGHELSDDSLDEKCETGNRRPSSSSGAVQERKSRKIGRCTLLARNSEEGQNLESDGYIPYTGKRTLLAWLIDSEMVQLSEKVQYMNRRRTRVKLEGWFTREGIHCSCCSKILTVSKFELHAGSKLRQPFQNIILESGLSLLECLVDAWNKQDESLQRDFYLVDVDGGDPDDDTCGICADGGDLICCDGCPLTFHQSCLGIQMLPPGDWHCPNCTCKFCGTSCANVSEEDETASELLTCNLCEKRYHKSCSKGTAAPLGTSDSSSLYCRKNCQEIHDHLQKILGVKHELQAGFSWSLLHKTDLNSDTENHGYPQRVECNSKLAVALSVMDECFLPIIDRRSGINQIHNVVYNCGSNFNRLNYRGFYTVVLERGDEIISTASIRLRGTQLAEMPFIGTRHMYRRQGMCSRLLSAIESLLCSLRIEKLIIPAISEHMQTWTGVFGFKPLEDSHRKEMKLLNMLVFPGADMLQKQLQKREISQKVEGIVSNVSSPRSHNMLETPNMDSSRKETRVQVDIASDAPSTSVEPQNLKSKCQSPAGASVDSLQFTWSMPRNPVRDDDQSSAKDLADCNHIGGSSIQQQDLENSSVVEAKSDLKEPAGASHDAGDMPIESDGCSSFKLPNGRVAEAVEDSALVEHNHRSSSEASFSNVVEQAAMEFPSVSSPSSSGDHVTKVASDLKQDNAIDTEVDDVDDSGRSNGAAGCLPKEASGPNVAEELTETVDPTADAAFQSSNGIATNSHSNSDVQKIFGVKNQPSAISDSDSIIDFDRIDQKVASSLSENSLVVNDEVPTIEHTLDSFPKHVVGDKVEGNKKSVPLACSEGDRKLSVSFGCDLKQQSSTVEAVSIEASENLSSEAVADVMP